MLFQRTLKARVTGSGVGLHSGKQIRIAILPAPPNSGITFVRVDTDTPIEIPARAEFVCSTRLATSLGKDDVAVGTVEHVMAAFYGLGIDNARIEIDGPEMPIMDGSAAPFVSMILEAGGTVAQRRPKRFVVIRRTVSVSEGPGRTARLEPDSSLHLDCTIDFDHPLISDQRFEMRFTERAFLREICRARTFGFARDVESLRAQGLALGGSLDNAVVIDAFSVQNPDGLRFPNEFVRHKILDTIGDLALLGAPLVGRYTGHRSGHSLNTRLVARLLADPRSYEIVEFRQRREAEGRALVLPTFGLSRLASV